MTIVDGEFMGLERGVLFCPGMCGACDGSNTDLNGVLSGITRLTDGDVDGLKEA